MLGAAIIVFREVLEAALIIGIVLAASNNVPGRNLWVGAGVLGGLAGAVVVALFAQTISNAADGLGQELFNAAVLLAAVAMLGWHNVWMTKHGRELAAHMSQVGRDVESGARPLYFLFAAVGLAVLREGSEIVLFMHGLAASGGSAGLAIGSFAGLGTGALVGALLYFGLVRIPTRYLFVTTNWMILLLAAGMASQAAAFLEQAGMVPAIGMAIWDTSRILPENGVIGQLLHTLIGYDDRPAGVQIVFYVCTLLVILTCMLTIGRPDSGKNSRPVPQSGPG